MIIYSMLALLLSNAVTPSGRRDKSILYSRKTVIILLCSCLLVAKSLDVSFLDRGVGLYGGLFHATPITHTFHLFIFFLSAIILQLTAFYPRVLASYTDLPGLFTIAGLQREDDQPIDNMGYTCTSAKQGQQFKIIEYPLLLIFIIIGGTFLVSASDIVSIFLSIELQSYGLYLLSTLYRNSELATSAGLTYFLLGGLSSCFILLGTSLLYANSGTTSLEGYYVLTGLSSIATGTESATTIYNTPYNPLYLNVSLSIMSVGFLFKISAAPFHFWSPDVYDAIPTIVTTFVAIVAKISILVFLLETAHYTSPGSFLLYGSASFSWTSGLLFSSLASLIIGSVLGLTQARIKRLFAYSTISHLGFILLALSINSLESTQGFLFYLMVYSISNVNAFILLVTIGFSLYPFLNAVKADSDNSNDLLNVNHKALLDRNNSPIQITSQMKGYFSHNPVLALSLGITLFSFVGIPPLAGFFAKQMVLSAALDSGYVFLAIVAILTSVVSAVYYLGVIKQIFFDVDDSTSSLSGGRSTTERGRLVKLKDTSANSNSSALSLTLIKKIREDGSRAQRSTVEDTLLSFSLTVTISILTLALLSFIFTPQESLSMTSILALTLFNP